MKAEIHRVGLDEGTMPVLRIRHRALPGDRYAVSVRRAVPAAFDAVIKGALPDLQFVSVSNEELIGFYSPLERRSDGEGIAVRLVEALRQAIDVNGLPHHLSSRVGAALLDDENPDATHPAMLFHPYQRVQNRRQREMEDDLRSAVLKNEPNASMQPSIDLKTGRVVALKVSARWQRNGRGFVPPLEFVPAADAIGISHLLGRQVLQRALFVTSDLVDDGLLGEVTLRTSVAPAEVLHPDFVQTVLDATRVNPRVKVGLEMNPTPP
ncbi:MAG: hypothetical protein ACI8TP_002751, partial [Acidimicrobiales bacterium]